MALTLYIGSKNLSSWSLRPWLALKHTQERFEEVVIPLDLPDTKSRIAAISPSGRVPVLVDGACTVWESLAICEHLAERFPSAKLWPEDPVARAHARSVATEMHAGFADLRRQMPMNLRARKSVSLSPEAEADVARVLHLWRGCRERFGAGGPFLFGKLSIADAMYAPVVTRFETYGRPVDATARAYMDAIWALPAMQAWRAAAEQEA